MSNPIISFLGGQLASNTSGMFTPLTTSIAYSTNRAMPVLRPELNELASAFGSGVIGEKTFKDNALFFGRQYLWPHGAIDYTKWDSDRQVADLELKTDPCNLNALMLEPSKYLPSFQEANVLFNRGLISSSLYTHIMERQTTLNPALAEAQSQLRFEIPGPSDLVRFAVRDCFSPEIVNRFEYAKETPIQIKSWMDKQGLGQSIGLDIPANATDADGNAYAGNATWFDLHWWSHWELPSPTQAYEMLHRLYGKSDYGPSPFTTPENVFDQSDLELLLKTADYPHFWRERLVAISYHDLNPGDANKLYDRGLIDDERYYHAMRSAGYRDAEAKTLLSLAQFSAAQFLGVDIRKQTKDWVCKHFSEGWISREAAITKLQTLGLKIEYIRGFLDNCVLEQTYKLNTEVLDNVKRGYLNGILGESDARDILNTFLVSPIAIGRYISSWTLLRNGKYKQLSARKQQTAYENGLISRNEFIARMQNLQYESVAISTMLSLSDWNIGQRNLKRLQQEASQQAKLAKVRAKQIADANKEAAKKAKTTQSNIEKFNKKRMHKLIVASTDKNIVQWYHHKLIDLWEVFYRLYYKDFTIRDAMLWVKNKLSNLNEEELVNAEIKAQKVYRSEPNPPLV